MLGIASVALSGCSLVSISLPSSLFGISDPNQHASEQQGSIKTSSWLDHFKPDKDPAALNRRRPVYNPSGGTFMAQTSPSMPTYASPAMPPPPTAGMHGTGGFADFYAQMPGGPPTANQPSFTQGNPYRSDNTGSAGVASNLAPDYSVPSFDYSAPSVPDGPSDAQIQQHLQTLGWGKNSQGSYNPFKKYKEDAVFEPLSASYTLIVPTTSNTDNTETTKLALFGIGDSFRSLTSVPETPSDLDKTTDKLKEFEVLEEQRDSANQRNIRLRSPDEEIPPVENTETEAFIAPAPEPVLTNQEPSFLDRIQQLITIDVDINNPIFTDDPHRVRQTNTHTQDFSSQSLTPPSKQESLPLPKVTPYQAPEAVLLSPSRYKARREGM